MLKGCKSSCDGISFALNQDGFFPTFPTMWKAALPASMPSPFRAPQKKISRYCQQRKSSRWVWMVIFLISLYKNQACGESNDNGDLRTGSIWWYIRCFLSSFRIACFIKLMIYNIDLIKIKCYGKVGVGEDVNRLLEYPPREDWTGVSRLVPSFGR